MKKKSIILITIGILLIISALTLTLYNSYQDKNAGIKSNEIREKLEEVLVNNSNEKEESKTINIDGNNYIGIIYIEDLDLKLPIMNDWDYTKMQISPCRYYGEIQTNNLVICAHSYKSMFKSLKNLNQGDKITIIDINNQEYNYEVELLEVLSPTSVTEMIESEFDLTLFTCTDDSSSRLTVRLNRI